MRSRISGLIAYMRYYAAERKGELAKLINDAADTIEELSAKLHASQMERSSQYYHGGWIPCSERLPGVGEDVLFSVSDMYSAEGCIREDGDWAQFRWNVTIKKDLVTAWMPLPEPYKGES